MAERKAEAAEQWIFAWLAFKDSYKSAKMI